MAGPQSRDRLFVPLGHDTEIVDVFLTDFLATYGAAAGGVVLGLSILTVWVVAHRQANPGDSVSVFFGLASYNKGKKLSARPKASPQEDEEELLKALGLRFLSKLEASELLHRRLADPEIRHVSILTYTNEVEAGAITKYRVRGQKTLEILKRSPLTDLQEEQVCNLTRLTKRSNFRPWRKFRKSIEASEGVEGQAAEALLRIEQWCYPDPPQRRAYVFDGVEALVSYYEFTGGPDLCDGSLHKGMGESYSLLVSQDSRVGRFILDDVKNTIAILKARGRPWADERERIRRARTGSLFPVAPVVEIRGVMLDLDGVLYDSLPHYVRAWTAAFSEQGVRICDRDVYLHEGRPGAETIRTIYAEQEMEPPSEAVVEQILQARDAVLADLGPPPLQKGAAELLDTIERRGLPVAVVTGSSRSDLPHQLSKDFRFEFVAGQIVTGRDVPLGKPSPVPFLIAADRLGIPPAAALTVENAPLGTLAATLAGSFVVAVNTGILDDTSLTEAGAALVFRSCTDLSSRLPRLLEELRESGAGPL